MQVRALRRTDRPSPLPAVELADDIRSLVTDADHIVVAAPATPSTRHLVNAAVLDAMRDGVHLVNVARGALIDQQALRVALDSGKVARATLDTCDPEPLPNGHWLYAHPRVRLSPHISWSSSVDSGRVLELFIENLHARREGGPLAGIVDAAEGY
jgi:phosphoglycerate dehydrogenase-like enzyme